MDAFDETSRRRFLELATVVATGVAIGGLTESAQATPPTGEVTRTPLAQGRLDDRITVSTQGPSDFHIQQVVVQPGADSGWHTHPGTALDIVKSGSITAYVDGADCNGVVVDAGQAFFVPAGVTHLARNQGSEPAEIYVTYLVAAGTEPRTDADKPECRPA
jgi:quercetin dioxygenase-like cupin family protein